MTKFRNYAIAGAAGLAIIAAGAVAAPTQAEAKGKHWGAFGVGVVAGVALSHATRPIHASPVIVGHVPVRTCTIQNQFRGYDVYGRAVYARVQVCH